MIEVFRIRDKMILEKVDSPQDLRKLPLKDLPKLSKEIRELIMDVSFRKGGHLASSLGAVELCIALHYCFDTPKDSIIFDVGHQCYAHKILTGRKKEFATLREHGGISGFPNPQESKYDLFFSGHASTAVSWAVGIAEAKKIQKEKTKTVAVIGDGSLTGGMCFEALNICGHQKSDVLVILNHNEMSISRSVGALSNYLTKLLSLPIYNKIKEELEQFLKHMPPFAKKLAHKARKFEEALKGLIVPGLFFEELGFRYFGPLDGHNLGVLTTTLKNLRSLSGPRLLHVITKKGKGYLPAEENPERFHSTSPLSLEVSVRSEKKESFGEALAKKLISLARKDERIVAFTAAMPEGTGLNLFKKEFPERFFDVGIAEANAVGMAAGIARQGLKPVVAMYSTFLQRAYDQIIHDVALQNLKVIFAIDRAGFVGEDGPTHHGSFDIGYLNTIPRMVCMASKDKEELQDMLEYALTLSSPVSIRYPKGESYSLGKREEIVLGKAQVLEKGKGIAIIAVGSMVKEAKEAAALLKKDGLTPLLVNARFIKPLDEELLRSAASTCHVIITIEEGTLKGGFGSSVLGFYEKVRLLEKLYVKRIGIPDEFCPCAKREELLKMYRLDARSLYQNIFALAKKELLWQR